jgi:hypothetical protein
MQESHPVGVEDHVRKGIALQKEIFRRMSGVERLQAASELRAAAFEIKAAGLRAAHPEWTQEQGAAELRRISTYAHT